MRIDERAAEFDVQVDAVGEPWQLILRRSGRQGGRQGWATLNGARFEAVVLGTPPSSVSAADTLQGALKALAMRMGDPLAEVVGFDALPEAWRQAAAAKRSRVALAGRVRNNALVLARGLQGAELAGLHQQQTARSEDGRWIEVSFGRREGILTLFIGLEPAADAGSRPPLRHTHDGWDAEHLAAFSQALGRHLQGHQRAVAADRPAR